MGIKESEISSFEGNIYDILRFSIHDGPGIRTTVFMKGCPLRCLWCHNSESQEKYPELSYAPEKCIGCGLCRVACGSGCHDLKEGIHYFDRTNCVRCFACSETCFSGALTKIGVVTTVDMVIKEVLKDRSYYIESKGGMTISGGEPFVQPGFLKGLLQSAKANGLHTCVETCGHASLDDYFPLLEYVDIFLYDFKESDPILHKQFTGVTNERIIKNLSALDIQNSSVILRCPIIPGLNDRADHFKGIARVASSLKNILEVNIMPYHPYGITKGIHIGRPQGFNGIKAPESNTVDRWIDFIQSKTDVRVCRG